MPCPEDSVLRSLESYVAQMGPPSLRPEDQGCLTSAAPSQYEVMEAFLLLLGPTRRPPLS